MPENTDQRYLATKVAMMPRDTNQYGTIFGGVLLSYIDLAGAIGARHEIRASGLVVQQLVTVAMDAVEFHQPVFVGDTVSFWTVLKRMGTTSVTMRVAVETERDARPQLLTQAEVTYVSVELHGTERKPVAIRRAAES